MLPALKLVTVQDSTSISASRDLLTPPMLPKLPPTNTVAPSGEASAV